MRGSVGTNRSWASLGIEVALHAVAAYGIGVVAWAAWTGDMADAVTYALAVGRWLGGESPYTAMQSQPYPLYLVASGMGYIYPPPSLPLLLPLAGGHGVLRAWAFAGGISVAIVAALLVRDMGRRVALAVFGLTLLLPMNVDSGQASPWIASAVGLSYAAHRWGSVAAAAAGALKIYPLLAVRWWPALAAPAALGLVTAGLWPDWIEAWLNGRPSCVPTALPSVTCAIGTAWPAYALAVVLLLGAWRAPRPVGFFLLTVAMIVPAPDLFHGYLLVPYMGMLVAVPHVAGLAAAR